MGGKTTSLSRKFLISVGAMSIVVTAVAFVAAFIAFEKELEKREIAYLQDYVTERANQEERRFTDLADAHQAAAAALKTRIARLSDAKAAQLFDRYYPLQADGTRRSRDSAFDGESADSGDYTYGTGAFISNGRDVSLDEKKLLVAAYETVPHFGEALVSRYDNFYFYTPGTRLVMFGPKRPDRLMFYRSKAPADLDVSKEEMVQITLPNLNPDRIIRCTNLQRLVQDKKGDRLGTACVTPVDLNGRHVGAFGSSIELTGYFLRAIRDTSRGATNLIITDKGELIAYPGFAVAGKASEDTVASYERDMGLKDLAGDIRVKSDPRGVVRSRDGRYIVAYGRLRGPGWYFLIRYPAQAMTLAAAGSAAWILVLGVIAALIQTALVMAMARKTIALPLRQLAAYAERERQAEDTGEGSESDALDRAELARIEARPDEIGVLARALQAGRERVATSLDDLEGRVKARTAELERANQEKSLFLANMSHELRTPLNGVVAVSETLAREQTTPRNRELAELIVSSGRLLEQVLTDILDFSKIEAGEMRLEIGEFDAAVLTGRIAELHAAAAEGKNLTLTWFVDEAAQGVWRGDSVRITQILSNLLSNAVKFTESGGAELRVSRTGEGLAFAVRDTGIGFDAETGERLFKRFEQADASITRRFGGTGLGLAICRLLAGLMGGEVEAVSTPGQGSVFTVSLPLQRLGDSRAAGERQPAGEGVDVGGALVLLAEDHPTNQRVVRLILEAAGVRLDIVENGRAALERLDITPYDLVLMDMQMPEMDGLTATRLLRGRETARGGRRTPVIMLTANALDEHVRASLEAGADSHLSKPVRADTLLAAVAAALDAGNEALAATA
ncbi:signal transduction histidine kinase/ActR/RegA family two-component response regulator [Caulobacter ginsengisoli]|uniref:histidine kinase n=1 Tax=Caulobacter ginsengisoli TaxID=400775 RepID=A0ABU0IKW2_9CAUL|nr:ATP-binding protein [Caulobacter ginsengisoli]MDQ0462651.1 signal transduction histidine kinase/ActR/RegA family two-component response regulator [Caulobacter ginsengisoli]